MHACLPQTLVPSKLLKHLKVLSYANCEWSLSVYLWFLILNLCQTFVADPSFTLPTFWYPLSAYDCCWLQLCTSAWPQFCLLTWYYTACTLPTSACSWHCFCLQFCVLQYICYQLWPVTWLTLNFNLVFPLCNTSCIAALQVPLTSSGTCALPSPLQALSYLLPPHLIWIHIQVLGRGCYATSGLWKEWAQHSLVLQTKKWNTEPLLRSCFSIVL